MIDSHSATIGRHTWMPRGKKLEDRVPLLSGSHSTNWKNSFLYARYIRFCMWIYYEHQEAGGNVVMVERAISIHRWAFAMGAVLSLVCLGFANLSLAATVTCPDPIASFERQFSLGSATD